MKRTVVLLAVLVLGIALIAGCGGKSGGSAASSGGDSSSAGASSGGGSGAMAELNVKDCFFVNYPEDKFAYGEFLGQQLVARDESSSIHFTMRDAFSSLESNYEYLDGFKDSKGYSSENLTIAGFKARRVTYTTDFGDYGSDIFIDFDYKGTDSSGYRGISISIESSKDFNSTWTPDIKAVLESARVKQ